MAGNGMVAGAARAEVLDHHDVAAAIGSTEHAEHKQERNAQPDPFTFHFFLLIFV